MAFGHQVELAPGDRRELALDPHHVDPPANSPGQPQPAQGMGEGGEVGLHQHLDTRSQHLDHDLLPGVEDGAVRLRERSRAHGGGVE